MKRNPHVLCSARFSSPVSSAQTEALVWVWVWWGVGGWWLDLWWSLCPVNPSQVVLCKVLQTISLTLEMKHAISRSQSTRCMLKGREKQHLWGLEDMSSSCIVWALVLGFDILPFTGILIYSHNPNGCIWYWWNVIPHYLQKSACCKLKRKA